MVLPETSAQDTAVTAQPVSRLSHLFSGSLRLTTAGIWSVYFFNWVAWFMLLSWLPTLLKQAGLAPADAPYASVTVNAAFIAFALPLSWFLPRINTLKILYLMFAVGIAVALALSVAILQQLWLSVFLLIALAGFGVGGQQLALNYLVVATYPAAVRATAMGWAIGMGRMGAIVGSAIGGLVLSSAGTGGFFLVLIVPLVISFASLLLLRRRYVQQQAAQDGIAVH
ncbi:MFS transporter [Pseudocitrobacter faecalis]